MIEKNTKIIYIFLFTIHIYVYKYTHINHSPVYLIVTQQFVN